MGGWAWLTIAIIGEVIGTSALKASDGFQRFWPVLILIVGYAVGFFALSVSLTHLPLGIAYAVWSGIGIVAASAIGLVLFGEMLSWREYAGVAVILAGVVILNWPTAQA